ncbi:sugar transferase [Sphingomonas profundi]|uniref:sugar transferase n=1 Tax=Alterirhizorhabdus profundi TaxID=2681549 RepID=UPI0012E70AD1|nr:sugar transferase [Sphingomonas profundi]
MDVVASIKDGFDCDGQNVRPAASPRAMRRLHWLVKLAADRALALALLAFLLPALVLLVALIVCVSFGWPFFAHERVGRDGRTFRCLKLRSMRPNAAEMLRHILETDPAAAREWESNRKLRDDPRIIPLGRFIRATSLDELPQLFNILRGEMSFVGPRPITSAELVRYGAGASHYLAVTPGLTGLWQVSGRSDIGYAERVALDVDYVETWSLYGDLKILLRTPRAVLAMAGAC